MINFLGSKPLKSLSVSLLSLLMIFLFVTPTASAFTLDDLNSDGRIDVQDVTFLIKHILGFTTLTENQQKVADINDDGVINIQDVTLIMHKVLKLNDNDKVLSLQKYAGNDIISLIEGEESGNSKDDNKETNQAEKMRNKEELLSPSSFKYGFIGKYYGAVEEGSNEEWWFYEPTESDWWKDLEGTLGDGWWKDLEGTLGDDWWKDLEGAPSDDWWKDLEGTLGDEWWKDLEGTLGDEWWKDLEGAPSDQWWVDVFKRFY